MFGGRIYRFPTDTIFQFDILESTYKVKCDFSQQSFEIVLLIMEALLYELHRDKPLL